MLRLCGLSDAYQSTVAHDRDRQESDKLRNLHEGDVRGGRVVLASDDDFLKVAGNIGEEVRALHGSKVLSSGLTCVATIVRRKAALDSWPGRCMGRQEGFSVRFVHSGSQVYARQGGRRRGAVGGTFARVCGGGTLALLQGVDFQCILGVSRLSLEQGAVRTLRSCAKRRLLE